MNCSGCGGKFDHDALDGSHDVPAYLFKGRLVADIERKNDGIHKADKYGIHKLCRKCHFEYEEKIRVFLIIMGKKFSLRYWNEGEDYNDKLIEELIESELDIKELKEFFLSKYIK